MSRRAETAIGKKHDIQYDGSRVLINQRIYREDDVNNNLYN